MNSAIAYRAAILVAMLFLPTPASSQFPEMKFEHWSIEQGLSQSTVNTIAQDAEGFLWFGTQDGLNKFDGYAITVYKHRPDDSSSLSDNGIWCLARGRDADLWIGTMRGGLNRYDLRSERFTAFLHVENDTTSISDNNVTALLCDSRGRLWIGTLGGGLNLLLPGSKQFRHYFSPTHNTEAAPANTIWSLAEGKDGSIWVAEWGGLRRLLPDGVTWERYVHKSNDPKSLIGNQIRVLLVDREGSLWVGTWGFGLDRFDPSTSAFDHVESLSGRAPGLGSTLVLSLDQDRDGNIWIGTGDAGLTKFNGATKTLERIRSNPAKAWSLNNDIISALFTDTSGGLWIGTGAGGVNRYDRWRNRFPHYRNDWQATGLPHGNDVWAIATEPHGAVWIGTYGGGLLRMDRSKNLIEHYEHLPGNPHSLAQNSIIALCRSTDGSLWIGTEGGGLDRLLPRSNTFVHHRHSSADPSSIAQNEVTAILEDSRGRVWVGTNGSGLDRYDEKTGGFTHFPPDEKNPSGLSGGSVMALYQSRDGKVWVGTWGGGVNVLDPSTGKFSRFLESKSGLTNSTVLCIYEDSAGTVWLGTYGGGVNAYDPGSQSFRAFTDAEGLPNNVVYGILPDREGNLWLTTNKGLVRFSPSKRTFRVFDVNDGLQGNEFNQGAYHRSASGELFVGGVNGLNAFFPENITDNPLVPPVYITSFRIFDRPANVGEAVSTVQNIRLGYDQNFFSFEFVALDYSSPQKNRYAYRLEGLDEAWIDAGTRRYASYTNLDPGHYVFRCRGSNSDGVWNESGASIALFIDPPYWQTWWFRLTAAIVVLGSLFLLYRMRVNKLIAIERIRTSIATDLHDDIGSTLTEIALFSDVGKRILAHGGDGAVSQHGRDEATQKLDDIGDMARGLIDSMSDIVWSVNPKNDTIESLMLRMRMHASRVLDAKGIRYELTLPSVLPQQALQPAVRRALYLIFKEAVNNVVRHSNAHDVRLEVARDRSVLKLTIEDNGRGFDIRSEGMGNGVANMRNRAVSLGGQCTFASTPGTGTTVHVEIPLR